MNRMKRYALTVLAALALAASVAPAAHQLAGQRSEVENRSRVYAALLRDPQLLDQPEPQDNVEVAGARRRLTEMF